MSSKTMVITLALASFTGLVSQAALSPLLPVVANDVGSTVPVLAQTITVSFLVGALLALVIGPLADYFGHRRMMLVGVGLVVISAFGTALATNYWTVLLTRLPGGIGGGMMAAITVVLASTRFPPDQRRWAIGWTVSGISAAPIVGLPGLAFVGEQFGWRASFILLGLFGLLSGVLLRWAVAADENVVEERFRIRNTIDAYRPLIANQIARRLQISNLLRAIGWGAALTYISAYLFDVHGLSLQGIGYLFVVTGIGYFLGTRFGDGRYARFSLRSLFMASTALMGFMLGGLLIVDMSLWLLLLPLIIGVSAGGIGFVTLTIMVSEESPTIPATAMMLRQSGFSLGLAGGGALGGLALALGGYDLLGVGVLIFALASSAAVYRRAPGAVPVLPEPELATISGEAPAAISSGDTKR